MYNLTDIVAGREDVNVSKNIQKRSTNHSNPKLRHISRLNTEFQLSIRRVEPVIMVRGIATHGKFMHRPPFGVSEFMYAGVHVVRPVFDRDTR